MARAPVASRSSIHNLMRLAHSPTCPCHGCSSLRSGLSAGAMRAGLNMIQSHNTAYGASARDPKTGDAGMEREYAFELAASSIRYGEGVTREVEMDFKNMKATKVSVFTDSSVRKLTPLLQAVDSLDQQGVQYEIFDKVRVELNDLSWQAPSIPSFGRRMCAMFPL
ncbi:hypothetical protein OC845_006968 [Tilletia horrida]|nr:hypothetical protein OC845_006968 [Tilletia horrida]